MNREIPFAVVVAGILLANGLTIGAIEGARAIDRHLATQACLTERTLSHVVTDGCFDLRASF